MWDCVFRETAHQPHHTVFPLTVFLEQEMHHQWTQRCSLCATTAANLKCHWRFARGSKTQRGFFWLDRQLSISDGTLNSFCRLHLHEWLTRDILSQSVKVRRNPLVLASPTHSWSQKSGRLYSDAYMEVLTNQEQTRNKATWCEWFTSKSFLYTPSVGY